MTSPNEVSERLNFAAIGLRSSVSILITSETELSGYRSVVTSSGSQKIHLSVAIRWLMRAHASSGRALLRFGVTSAGCSGHARLLTL